MSSYVIYARKSTESEDRQILSIDSQIQELRQIAARRGIPVAEVLSESKSAKAPGRPGFDQLLRRVQRGEIVGVLCWKMDRLSRNHLDTGRVLQALADGKLREVITSDRTYTRDGNDRFMGNFELGMATKYIDDLRANVKRGNRARLQRGWITHTPPLGYLLDPATKTVVKDPERFDLVRRMWEMLLTGAIRPDRILRVANAEWDFRTRTFKRMGGKPLGRSLLYRIFASPFYSGLIRLRSGESFVGAHPPMITPQEFERAQEILGRPGRPRPQRHELPYTGLIRCGGCGASVTAEVHAKSPGRRYVYYRCTRPKTGPPCREPAISERELEEQIARWLATLAIPRRVLAWTLERVNQALQNEEERRETVRSSLSQALAGLDRERETLLGLRLRDLIDDATFASKKKTIDDERQRILVKIEAPGRSPEQVSALTAETFRFAARLPETFRNGTSVQRRMILDAVGLNYELRERRLRTIAKNPFRIIADEGARDHWSACADAVRKWIADTTEYFAIPNLENAGNPDGGEALHHA
jgi:DNA invertase Pin-like site-specific DNA recombinase